MNTKELITVNKNIADRIFKEKEFLTELDNAIADGDHGINMNRGFSKVKETIDSYADKLPGDFLKSVGMLLVSTVGGAAGPLFGTMYMKLGMALSDVEEFGVEEFLQAFSQAIEGVAKRGGSAKDDKTMLDAMIPAHDAMLAAYNEGKATKEIFSNGVEAAKNGVEYTKTIAAKKGRASYVGDRSIGHQDPGATSFLYMLEEIEKTL